MATASIVESPQFTPASRLSTTDEPLHEVVDGKRVELPPMSIYASWVTARLHNRMGPYAESHLLGTVVSEALFVMSVVPDQRRRPDLAFVANDRWPVDRPVPTEGDWQIIPNLAVEVISPNEPFQNVLAKVREYFHFGVQQVWVVVPSEAQIYVYDSPNRVRVWRADESLDGGSLLPGFRLPVGSIFGPATATPTEKVDRNGGEELARSAAGQPSFALAS